MQVHGSAEGGQTMRARSGCMRAESERVSQEATWAGVSSPVSRLLNPVSTGTKREEAQPPTVDISESLYNATR